MGMFEPIARPAIETLSTVTPFLRLSFVVAPGFSLVLLTSRTVDEPKGSYHNEPEGSYHKAYVLH